MTGTEDWEACAKRHASQAQHLLDCGTPLTGGATVKTVRPSADMVPRHELNSIRFVLQERERELLEVKGRCSNKQCRLHYAHYGPCDRWKTEL